MLECDMVVSVYIYIIHELIDYLIRNNRINEEQAFKILDCIECWDNDRIAAPRNTVNFKITVNMPNTGVFK